FFCSFGDPQLVKNVREGRTREFATFAWQGEVPDPQGEATFASARLSWSWPEGTPRAGLRALYADLLAARRRWPALPDFDRRQARLDALADQRAVLELVRGPEGQQARAYFNLAARAEPLPGPARPGEKVLFSSEARRYGGSRHDGG